MARRPLPRAWMRSGYLRREPSSPALATIAAMGGISAISTDMTMAAVTEKMRTTVHAKMMTTTQPPIRTK
jgi:hypothetical protein